MARRPTEIVKDEQTQAPIAGVLISVVNAATGLAATLTYDGGAAMANPTQTDSYGAYYYNATDAVYIEELRYGGRLIQKNEVIVGSPPAFKGDPGVPGNDGPPGPEGPIGGSVFPDGTVQRFVDLVTTAGTTVSSTAQAALLVVEYQLRQSGLLSKIVRLNLRCGVGVAAARIPFVQRFGCGAASDSGTISGWTEANGLTGATVNTGVLLREFGGSGYNLGLFQYFLTDNSGGDLSYTIGASDSAWGFSPRFTHETNPANPAFGVAVFTTFAGSGVARGDLTRRIAGVNTYPMIGTFGATRDASGLAAFHRNGVMLTGAAPAVDQPNPDVAPPSQAISVFTTNAASGGEAITEGLTPAEAAMLHIIIHGFNVAIGRGVTAEGL